MPQSIKQAEWKEYEKSQVAHSPAVALVASDREPEVHPWDTWEDYICSCEDTSLVRACAAQCDSDIPAMPVVDCSDIHRDKIAPRILPFNALVARSVGKGEIRRTPEAQAALKKEWDKLVDQKVWDVPPCAIGEMPLLRQERTE